jgi:hypothetical protein
VAATGLVAGHASAQACPGGTTRLTGAALQTLIGNNTLCAASSSNSDTWQEYHQGASSGNLIDWKQGPGHPVDPTATVGTWAVGSDANALLTHTYGASVYSWMVCQQGTTNNFVLASTSGAATVSGVVVKAGQGACASLAPARSIFDVRPANRRAPVPTPATRAP